MIEIKRPDLNGAKAITANICQQCGETLRATDGTFSETLYDNGRSAYAMAICNTCKRGENYEDKLAETSEAADGQRVRRSKKRKASSLEEPSYGIDSHVVSRSL